MIVDRKVPQLRFSEFKKEWVIKKNKELLSRVTIPVKVEKNQLYSQIGIRSHGKGIFYKVPVTGNDLGKKRVFWLKKNMFIVNIVFAWEQAVAITTEKEEGLIASHRFPMYRSYEGISNINYLLHFYLTPKGKFLLGIASPGGAGRNKTLGQKEFEKLNFFIPSNEEQTRIATVLTAVDKRITLLQKKKEALEQYKKGIMQKLLTLDTNGRPALRFKAEDGNDYADWKEKTLGEIGITYNGLTGKTKVNFGMGKPYIQYVQIFKNSKIDVDNFGFVEIAENEKQNKVQYGDIFFTTSSETPNEIGTSSVLLNQVGDTYLNSFCFGFRPKQLDELVPEFSQYFFRSELVRKEIVKLAQGSTRFNMSKIQFMKLIFYFPKKNEQKKIASFLSSIDKSIEKIAYQVETSRKWKKGLLQRMFV